MPDSAAASSIFSRAWRLLTRNWVIIVPSIVIGLAVNFFAHILEGPDAGSLADAGSGAAMYAFYMTTIVLVVVQILGSVLSIAFTTGMAKTAWTGEKARLSDGLACFARHPWSAIGSMVLLLLIGFIAAALIVPTFFISFIAYVVFFIYTMPAVFVGDRSPTDAIVESCTLAAQNLRTTILVVLLILTVALGAWFLARLAGAVPYAGPFFEAVFTYTAVAYGTLVVVGEYLQLRRT